MTFQDQLRARADDVQIHLDEQLRALTPSVIRDGMAHALSGGKRLRAFLVLESAALHGVAKERAIWAAASIEALHAFSLVHDDLPCMDDDDMRRGQPTVHRKWDEATAVLVGDALQTMAFDLLTSPAMHPDAAVRVDLIASLARGSGANGMVLGQAQDIAAETVRAPLSLGKITELQSNKTGALIRWSAEAGARLAKADLMPMTEYATAIGLAFQIADDILDIEGDADKAGKRLRKDGEAGKATFVSLLGVEGAKFRAQELVDEACDALQPFGAKAESLRAAARFVISREM